MDSYFRTYSQLHTNTCVGHLTTGQGLPAMLTSIVVEAHACDDPHDSYDLLFGAASRLYRARTSSGFTENHPVIAATINTVSAIFLFPRHMGQKLYKYLPDMITV